ncbi:M23 family metallopeptidase [Deinococcus yavapaiensis]|uniref:Peptidase M23-like protein n=1 Tax=Deinococcus yavapaiensis KR-236 TaxID=694435 RepID=A0A318S531_9DEIO|nr:M23 family metallopeptidase [Deinococcus yavapaiensis]PYE50573.1 peptidase M23-like protein [Deinococcus yavapaiensis KR-236]
MSKTSRRARQGRRALFVHPVLALGITVGSTLSGSGSAAGVSFPTGALAVGFLNAIAGSAGDRVTQGYGDNRRHTDDATGGTVDRYGYGNAGHNGWDIALGRPGKDGTKGAVVHAPYAGKAYTGQQKDAKGNFVGLGRWVKLVVPEGVSLTLGHLASFGEFKNGASVKVGAILGYEGSSGNSTGYHMHVMLSDVRGYVVDPSLPAGVASVMSGTPLAVSAAKSTATTAEKSPPSNSKAVAAAERALSAARADYELLRELYTLGTVARVEVERGLALIARAEVTLADAKRGVTALGSAVVASTKQRLQAADAAYRAARQLFEVGGISRQEVEVRAVKVTEARAGEV